MNSARMIVLLAFVLILGVYFVQHRQSNNMDIETIISQLTEFPNYSLDDISKKLGLSFVRNENENSLNEFFDLYEGVGSGSITSAEMRINKTDSAQKILILNIDPKLNISRSKIASQYPDASLSVHQPNDPIHTSLTVIRPWGRMSFGFNQGDVLTRIVFDSI